MLLSNCYLFCSVASDNMPVSSSALPPTAFSALPTPEVDPLAPVPMMPPPPAVPLLAAAPTGLRDGQAIVLLNY